MANGVRRPVDARAMPRFDMTTRRSGFWALVPVQAGAGPVSLSAEVEAADGARERVEIGRIGVAEATPTPSGAQPQAVSHSNELIAICMATFEPRLDLLEAQLESLRGQSDAAWVCVISDDHSSPQSYAEIQRAVGDDARFTPSRAPARIGFYRNFERAVMLAPRTARLIALCDQDDVWHPEKLALLRENLGGAGLVYCDQRLVDTEGHVLRETMWQGRANNHTDLASMLMANTITGASALMRREVADLAVPFPDSPGIEFHDHWLGLVALASGEIRYLDRPLYDYVQHEGAILGKVARRESTRLRTWRPKMREWRAAYFLGYVPGRVRAATLLLRCGDRMTPAKRRGLKRYLACERSAWALLWLLVRPLRAVVGRNETLGTEWELARGVVWRRLAGALARIPGLPERLLLDCRFPDPPHYENRRLQRWRSRI